MQQNTMTEQMIEYRIDKNVTLESILGLYNANHWSSARKPEQLYNGLMNSDSLVTAWHEGNLVGLANAISDGHLVVYFPHVVVHPKFHRCGIGKSMMDRMLEKYQGFHQQSLIADQNAVHFFKSCGFQRAGATSPMWIFDGDEH